MNLYILEPSEWGKTIEIVRAESAYDACVAAKCLNPATTSANQFMNELKTLPQTSEDLVEHEWIPSGQWRSIRITMLSTFKEGLLWMY